MQALLDRGISTRRGVMNIHLEQAYADQTAFRSASSLQRSTSAQSGVIILPLFVQMNEADVSLVANSLAEVLGCTE
jgi:dTDP-4-amino-4,6-dideoxygalactose transaminase